MLGPLQLFSRACAYEQDDVSCLRMSMISYVMNADIGRYADAFISYAAFVDVSVVYRWQ